jgi:hypothetical protein
MLAGLNITAISGREKYIVERMGGSEAEKNGI